MIFILQAGFGIALTSFVFFLALSLRRPVRLQHLLLAVLMGTVGGYFLLQRLVYSQATWAADEPYLRLVPTMQLLAGLTIGWFAKELGAVRLPKWVSAFAVACTVALIAWNHARPYTLFYAEEPQRHIVTVFGDQISVFSRPYSASAIAPLTFALGMLSFCLWVAVRLFRRGMQRTGVLVGISFGGLMAATTTDVLRDQLNLNLPFFLEFAACLMALLMSVEMALELRAKELAIEQQLAQLEASSVRIRQLMRSFLELRDRLNTPLQTLEVGVTLLSLKTDHPPERIQRLLRAIDQIAVLGRRLHAESQQDQ